MSKKKIKKQHRRAWAIVFAVTVLVLGIMIFGLYNEDVYHVFLSEDFEHEYLDLLDLDEPLIIPIIGVFAVLLIEMLGWFYIDRRAYERKAGTHNKNQKKRRQEREMAFRIFLALTLINIAASVYLVHNLVFLGNHQTEYYENLMFFCTLVLLPVNIAMTIGLGMSKGSDYFEE